MVLFPYVITFPPISAPSRSPEGRAHIQKMAKGRKRPASMLSTSDRFEDATVSVRLSASRQQLAIARERMIRLPVNRVPMPNRFA